MRRNPRSSSGCRTGWVCTGGLIAAVLVAVVGLGGIATFASTDPDQGSTLDQNARAKRDRITQTVVVEPSDASGDPVNEGNSAPPAETPGPTPGSGGGSIENGGTTGTQRPLDAPANDDCAGAITIPAGSYPYVTAPVDLTEATPQGVDEGVLTCATTDATVWWSFTPTVTGNYVFTTCFGAGATGSNVYDTVLAVFDSTGGACPQTTQLACNDTGAGCTSSGGGAPYWDQSTLSRVLVAGQTYFVVAGHWSQDVGGIAPGFNQVAVKVDLLPGPPNDTCAAPTPLALNRVVTGTTAGASNDYQVAADAACFAGTGQTLSTAPGRESVFTFTAPADGNYSIRYVQDDSASPLRGQNPVLYASSSCPASGTVSCLLGANRMLPATGQNRSEEIYCLPMTANQKIYVFFDDASAGNDGGPMALEVMPCNREVEPNDTTDVATPYVCNAEGTNNPTTDADFWSLGTPEAGSKVFAAIDGVASNDGDYRMRVTSPTDTLQFDDNDGTSLIASNAPVIGGAVTDGTATFLRVSRSTAVATEPYRLYAIVRPPIAAAQVESDTPENGGFYVANLTTGGGYVRGSHAAANDFDCFRFVAHAGDDIAMFSDNNPDRLAGPIVNTWPILYDLFRAGQPIATRFTGQAIRNNLTPSPGTLIGTTPTITSEFWDYRARYTGTHWVCYLPDGATTGATYPLPYAGSVSLNCGAIPTPASRITDVSVTKTGPVSPVATSSVIDYTITVTNNGTDIAQDVRLFDVLPANTNFVALFVNDGFGTLNVGCGSLPTEGTADAPVDCLNYSIAPGATTTWVLRVQVNGCIGSGLNISNTATISTASTDPNTANDSATWSFTTVDNGDCTDLDACTSGDRCVDGVCIPTGPTDCDDRSVCTDDSCDTVIGCINDPSPGQVCNDGIPCTQDLCDPITFCFFPPVDCDDGNPCTADSCDELTGGCLHTPVNAGTACDDGDACTTGDTCNANALCVGGAPPNCDDGNVCTDDSCSPSTGCVNAPVPGRTCDDANACTTADACDAAGMCVGGPPPNCDDGNVCTADSCDPSTGCVNAPTPGAPCSDGNACTIADTCNAAGQCDSGAPVICLALDQCHDPGLCDPGTGLCSNPNKPDGTLCTDNNLCTTGDACQSGVCTPTFNGLNEPNPRTNGYYKRLCQGPHSGDQLTDADAVCVGQVTATFAGFSTVAQICAVIEPSHPNNDKCDQTEDDLMVLALNICRARVCTEQSEDSQCGSNSSVGQSLAESDAILDSPSRNFDTCSHAKCLDEEINTGRALEMNTLMLSLEAGNVRLTWQPPYLDDGSANPKKYNVWRRLQGSGAAFVKIGDTTTPTFLDTTSGSSAWDYEITSVMN